MASERQPLLKKIQKWYDSELSEDLGAGDTPVSTVGGIFFAQKSTENLGDNPSDPFLPDNYMMEFNENGLEDDELILKQIPQWTPKEIVITIAALGASISASASLFTSYATGFLFLAGPVEALLCSIAGVLGVVIPTYSAYQEQKITDCRALKKTSLVLSHEEALLKENCDKLKNSVAKMEESTKNLSETKETLKILQAEERSSLTKLESQLTKKKLILKGNEELIANRVMNNVFSFIERSDTDSDGHYEEAEIRKMIEQIENTTGIDLDDEKFAVELGKDEDDTHDIGDVFTAMENTMKL